MARAPFQVLVFPYYKSDLGTVEYALFRRSDNSCWQGVAGGGQHDETPAAAAKREAWEEARVPENSPYLQLDTVLPIPVTEFKNRHLWGESTYVIPEYCFGVLLDSKSIGISDEHTDYRWCSYEEASQLMRYDGDKVALWELDRKARGLGPRDQSG
jgi:dATP pyrophosphohydrolase